jgi:2-polyprenyl-3-methyl-5-hydroxy-6-metoxy-1,4-benzoquinol methylase
MSKHTSEFFNSYSEQFDAIYEHNDNIINKLINKMFRKSILLRFQKTLAYCQPITGKSVLDVGCGPGHYCIEFAKMGAKDVYGIDFAAKMIEIASAKAQIANINDVCRFETIDFFSISNAKQYDYLVLMGFMDYVKDPLAVIQKAIMLTRSKILLSFPADNGFLAWQRKIRYHKKCPLYLYNIEQIHNLFRDVEGWKVQIERLSRDFFVVIERDYK